MSSPQSKVLTGQYIPPVVLFIVVHVLFVQLQNTIFDIMRLCDIDDATALFEIEAVQSKTNLSVNNMKHPLIGRGLHKKSMIIFT